MAADEFVNSKSSWGYNIFLITCHILTVLETVELLSEKRLCHINGPYENRYGIAHFTAYEHYTVHTCILFLTCFTLDQWWTIISPDAKELYGLADGVKNKQNSLVIVPIV
jgi:hypothetical protein